MSFVRRELPLILGGVLAALVITEYYVIIPPLTMAVSTVTEWISIIAGIAYTLGYLTLFKYHYVNVAKRKGAWYINIICILLMLITVIVGLGLGTTSSAYEWIYWNLSAQMFISTATLNCFYMVSTGYSAIRARTKEAGVFLITSLVVLITFTPLITTLMPSLKKNIGDWLVGVLNTGVVRGITIGIGVGTIAMGIRTLLGQEKAFKIAAEG